MIHLILKSAIPHGKPDDGYLTYEGNGQFSDKENVKYKAYDQLDSAKRELKVLLKGGPISDDGLMGEDPKGYFYSIASVSEEEARKQLYLQ